MAQKVGLVFSGGGAKGLAHIGVLKALEENHIPIDYITGTSMGAIVGGMYASGYTPAQIEKIALSPQFQDWVNGRFESDYSFFFQKTASNPSIITAKMSMDSTLRLSFRPTLVNDIPLNFELLELFAPASAVARGDFNHLLVPFRCMASDVLSQKSILSKRGSLAEAIRASMSVPLVYRPIKLDDKFVFDGGIYNNFPADVMKEEFNPDFMIGANVSSNTFKEYPKDDERLMNRFFMYMLLGKSDSTLVANQGVYIEPQLSDFSTINFMPVAELIQKGYKATIAKMDKIKAIIKRRVDDEELTKRRAEFNLQKKALKFGEIVVTGVNSQQKKYIERLFKSKDSLYTLESIKRSYYKLVADEAFESVYPRISYDRVNHQYIFEIQAQLQRKIKFELGGNISSRPISNVFLGAQINHLNRKAYTLSGNFYSGRFYESAFTGLRIDYPTTIPLFLSTDFIYNHWNYFNTSKIFVENPSINYIEQSDRKFNLKLGIPMNRNSRISLENAFINNEDSFSPDNIYLPGDIFDKSTFNGFKLGLSFEKNSLNRKQYASQGQSVTLDLAFITGQENYLPGNYETHRLGLTSNSPMQSHLRQWLKAKFSYEFYVLHSKHYSLGYLAEAIISNQPLAVNYFSTLLSSPAFFPLQDSRSLFLESFKAHQYAAGGLKNIINMSKRMELRLEAYVFLPYREFRKVGLDKVTYSNKFDNWHYAGTAGLVYQSPLGPVSLSYNLYDDSKRKQGVLLHLGYLIYNKRSLE